MNNKKNEYNKKLIAMKTESLHNCVEIENDVACILMQTDAVIE